MRTSRNCRFTSRTALSTTVGHVITRRWVCGITSSSAQARRNMSLQFDHTYCLDRSELETCLESLVSLDRERKQQGKSLFLLFSSSNSSIRCCPPTPGPWTQAAHQLSANSNNPGCPESSCSCFSRLVEFLGFILALKTSASTSSSSSSFPISTFPVALQLVQCHHQLDPDPSFTSALLCHILVSRLLRIVHSIGFC